MYDTKDPRSALASDTKKQAIELKEFYPSHYGLFYETEPNTNTENEQSWYIRSCNAVIAHSQAKPGAVLERQNQVDEYALLNANKETELIVTWNGETITVPGFTLTFIPAGESSITLPKGGEITRVFTSQSDDLIKLCSNATAYDDGRVNIPPLEPWPDPVDGFRVRTYSLDVPKEEGRFGRIFRCTTLMINILDNQVGPRDIKKLSPHHHDDFEQCSLAIEGSFVHHLRWPWTVDMTMWRDDEHMECKSPSVAVIPAPAIHTSRGIEQGSNQLVDIFSPPRIDFSKLDGWVLNADDYPLPQGA